MKLRSMRRMIAELFFWEKKHDWNRLRPIPVGSFGTHKAGGLILVGGTRFELVTPAV